MKKVLAILLAVVTIVTLLYLCNAISKPGHYFKIGKHKTSDVYLRATPEYEYQLVMEPDSIGVYYLGETIGKLPYESDLGHILLQDNE
jgi:hypothetical protein